MIGHQNNEYIAQISQIERSCQHTAHNGRTGHKKPVGKCHYYLEHSNLDFHGIQLRDGLLEYYLVLYIIDHLQNSEARAAPWTLISMSKEDTKPQHANIFLTWPQINSHLPTWHWQSIEVSTSFSTYSLRDWSVHHSSQLLTLAST